MNVRQLIKHLRRFPLDAEVGIQDHDASEHELSAKVVGVHPFDPAVCEIQQGCVSRCTQETVKWAGNVRVVIRAG